MGIVIDGWAAGIDSYFFFVEWIEVLNRSTECIKQLHVQKLAFFVVARQFLKQYGNKERIMQK